MRRPRTLAQALYWNPGEWPISEEGGVMARKYKYKIEWRVLAEKFGSDKPILVVTWPAEFLAEEDAQELMMRDNEYAIAWVQKVYTCALDEPIDGGEVDDHPETYVN